MTDRTSAGLRPRICLIEGCAEFIRAKGLCQFHYNRHLAGIVMDAPRPIPRIGPCLMDGCDRPRRSRGLCQSHYESARRSTACPVCGGRKQDRSALCDLCYRATLSAHLLTEKTCRQCDRTLPVEAFGARKSLGSFKWRSRCRECEATNARLLPGNAYRDREKERVAQPYLRLRKYAKDLGIPWAEVVERYPADNCCEICGRTPQEANPGGRFVRLALDHCHETGALRGFLCGPCNTGLGNLGDTPERVRAALKYLVAHYSATLKTSRRRPEPPGVVALFELLADAG